MPNSFIDRLESRSLFAAGPLVTSELLVGNHDAISGLTIAFNGPLDPVTAEDLDNYALVGVRNGQRTQSHPFSGATYDDVNHTVSLTIRELFSLRFFRRLRVTLSAAKPGDLADPSGNLLDGDRDGEAGGRSSTLFKVQRGRRQSYTDSDGDRIRLSIRGTVGRRPLYCLAGPGGIVHEIWMEGNNNTLIGTLKPRRTSDGITNIGRIVLENPTNATDLPATFSVGQIVTDGQAPVDPLIRTL